LSAAQVVVASADATSAMADLAIRRGASNAAEPSVAMDELRAALGDPAGGLVIVYCSPRYDRDLLQAALRDRFTHATVVGCTTAGEIGPLGYVEGSLSGVALSGADLRVAAARIDDLPGFDATNAAALTDDLRQRLDRDEPSSGDDTFGFVLIDGLCTAEEVVISALYRNLGDIPLVGGSAADGEAFRATYIYHEGVFRRDAAVLLLVKTGAAFEVFKTQHFERGSEKLVVTAADVARRIVTEINGGPAAEEYARVVGVEIHELTPLLFGWHPVVVRVGGEDYVRSIQKVNPDGSLTFFCAIDEGIVFTTARRRDLVANLESLFDGLRERLGPPRLVLGCDCILRRLECRERGLLEQVGRIYAENNVIGFATYGEQYNAMHINQTFTGVAIGRGAP
jgi:hypothetical protein